MELCCGDGFNTENFYSLGSLNVVGCDNNIDLIKKARLKNKRSNVTFELCDITENIPNGSYDNVIWDFGFSYTDYFSSSELDVILTNVKSRLSKNGIFSGHTMPARNAISSKFSITSKDELYFFLKKFFVSVVVFETINLNERRFYFYASHELVPFVHGWPNSKV